MRGVFERPVGSGVWWILYYADGVRHREKVGRKSDAQKLYQARKASSSLGVKLPELSRSRKVTVADLTELVLEYTRNHKDRRSYISKAKAVRKDLGNREAHLVKPTDVEKWLHARCKTAATYNRYKAFLSLAYRLGLRDSKVSINPARDALHRREPSGRDRFLSHEEYNKLCGVIEARFPEHLAEFVVSVNTGMRLAEQYMCRWSWFQPEQQVIRLPGTQTKNGKPRDVHLNADALSAIKAVRQPAQKDSDFIFPRKARPGADASKRVYDTRSWFTPCLQEAGIGKYVWHCNRHTFCSWLAQAGATTLEIMEAAGHSGPAMAARYSHLNKTRKTSIVHRITSERRESGAN